MFEHDVFQCPYDHKRVMFDPETPRGKADDGTVLDAMFCPTCFRYFSLVTDDDDVSRVVELEPLTEQ